MAESKMRKTPLRSIGKKKQAKSKKRGTKAYSTFTNKSNKELKRSPLKKISAKKRAELKAEMETRKQLCERAKGTWVKSNNLVGGYCKGGFCECGCGKPADKDRLHPHEKVHRGLGGKVSLKNSKMMLNSCHNKKQHNHVKREKVKQIV